MANKKPRTAPKFSIPLDLAIENNDVAESEDDQVIDPSLLGQAVVFGTDWTAATLIDLLRRGNIKLDPIFQRRDAWDSKRKSRSIESIVLGLPKSSMVGNDFSACSNSPGSTPTSLHSNSRA